MLSLAAISRPNHTSSFETRRQLLIHITQLINILIVTLLEIISGINVSSTPYHTSALSSHQWVLELICGHPGCIKSELSVKKDTFLQLVAKLHSMGLTDSWNVTLEEQLAIFLYTCVTGLTTRHVGERFQRSNDTISRYFKKLLYFLSSPPFYTMFVRFPTRETVPPTIRRNQRFWPYFRNTIGAIDGSHIPIAPPAHLRGQFRNRKGFLSQNALFICDFDLKFTYALTGWEGSATDARIYDDAISKGLCIPQGKYLLADAGYPLRPQLLVPYRGIRYHLAEWARADKRPKNKEEIFNLRHTLARNVIERIFGVLKCRFRILLLPLEYNLEVQARLPAALAALYNFIRIHKPAEGVHDDGNDDSEEEDDDEGDEVDENDEDINVVPLPEDNTANARARACNGASIMRDAIVQQMWDDYQTLLSNPRESQENDDDGDGSWDDGIDDDDINDNDINDNGIDDDGIDDDSINIDMDVHNV